MDPAEPDIDPLWSCHEAGKRLRFCKTYFQKKIHDGFLLGRGNEDFLHRYGYDDNQHLQLWGNMYHAAIKRLKFCVFIGGTQASNPHTVFESLNSRGKDLTELDKVKAYLLYLVSHVEEMHCELSD